FPTKVWIFCLSSCALGSWLWDCPNRMGVTCAEPNARPSASDTARKFFELFRFIVALQWMATPSTEPQQGRGQTLGKAHVVNIQELSTGRVGRRRKSSFPHVDSSRAISSPRRNLSRPETVSIGCQRFLRSRK